MNLEGFNDTSLEHEGVEPYDEQLISSLTSQGWYVDAKGLDVDEAFQMADMSLDEYRIFQKEDGTCTLLIKEPSALDEMNPESYQEQMNQEYYDRLPNIMGDKNNT
ncbi:hypothetical protein GF369_00035 [Candidatus Peregrinibacteria bacterium]|nr:hypothetical protein [Candidatus Peregrinibacteria bacterium]